MVESGAHAEEVANGEADVVGVDQAVSGMGPGTEVPVPAASSTVPTFPGVPLSVHDHVGPRPQPRPRDQVSDEEVKAPVDQGLAEVHGERGGLAGAQPGLVPRASERAAKVAAQKAQRRVGDAAAPGVLQGGPGVGVAVHHHSPGGQRTGMAPALALLDGHFPRVTRTRPATATATQKPCR